MHWPGGCAGEEDNRQALQPLVLLETLHKLKSTQPWQRQVEHDDIRTRSLVRIGIDSFSEEISQDFFAIRDNPEGKVEASLLKGASGPLHLLGIEGNQ